MLIGTIDVVCDRVHGLFISMLVRNKQYISWTENTVAHLHLESHLLFTISHHFTPHSHHSPDSAFKWQCLWIHFVCVFTYIKCNTDLSVSKRERSVLFWSWEKRPSRLISFYVKCVSKVNHMGGGGRWRRREWENKNKLRTCEQVKVLHQISRCVVKCGRGR